MINSLLELIGALFLAGLPIFLMLARIRRRRARAAETATGSNDRDGSRRRSWFSRLSDRRPDSDLAPFSEQAGGGEPAAPGVGSRGGASRSGQSRETRSGLEPESSGGYRSLSAAAPSETLMKRVDRYPPLKRAIVLKEILGPPRGTDAYLPGRNP